MSRESLVLICGLIVAATPYLGVPSEWKVYMLVVLGLLLVILGYSLRRSAYLRSIEVAPGERRADAFVEHMPRTEGRHGNESSI